MNNIIFGPIRSRRFGTSLGIDLSPSTKQCNYDCVYCELAPTDTVDHQSSILPVETIMAEVRQALATHPNIDVLTLTANGEPTLYPHLNELIDAINAIKGDIQTLILSNGSTIADPTIQHALARIDTVKLSLDCATPRCLKRIDRMHEGIDIDTIQSGMLAFKEHYRGTLIIEVLIVKGINDRPQEIEAISTFLERLRPARIDLGTIDRPPAYRVDPVSYETLYALAQRFSPDLPVHITHRKHGTPTPASYNEEAILSTLAKRPLTQEDIDLLFDVPSQKRLKKLLDDHHIIIRDTHGVEFFTISPENH